MARPQTTASPTVIPIESRFPRDSTGMWSPKSRFRLSAASTQDTVPLTANSAVKARIPWRRDIASKRAWKTLTTDREMNVIPKPTRPP